MNCKEFEIKLDLVLDERKLPESDTALVEHARGCASCTELLTTTSELLEGVRGLSIPEVDGTMSRRVMSELKRETVTTRPSLALIATALAATAAAVLVAAFFLPGNQQNQVAKPVLDEAPAEVEVAMVEPVDLDREMVLKLIKDTRSNVDKIPNLLTGGSSESSSAGQQPTEKQRDGLDEITESVVGSFGFLLDVLEETDRQPNS